MRELKAKDLAPFTKILAKMELKETIKAMFTKEEKDNGEMVSSLIWGIIENYHKAEKELFKFLADLEEKTVKEIEDLSLNEFIELMTELLSEKNFSFFKLASK